MQATYTAAKRSLKIIRSNMTARVVESGLKGDAADGLYAQLETELGMWEAFAVKKSAMVALNNRGIELACRICQKRAPGMLKGWNDSMFDQVAGLKGRKMSLKWAEQLADILAIADWKQMERLAA